MCCAEQGERLGSAPSGADKVCYRFDAGELWMAFPWFVYPSRADEHGKKDRAHGLRDIPDTDRYFVDSVGGL